jgi:methylthioribose-1-phosphate isomerase
VRVRGGDLRSIRLADDGWSVNIIDQRRLPFEFVIAHLRCLADAEAAIRDMAVRGAPLIGATAAYGLCLAAREDADDSAIAHAHAILLATRPTAVNLKWALDRVQGAMRAAPLGERAEVGYVCAEFICDEDVAANRAIGEHGLPLLRAAFDKRRGERLNLLTHCNAGWLATVDRGTALSPVYLAHEQGLPVHVWVDETRPRNQGAALTAWELGQAGVPHTVIVDNAGGHLMQRGLVDAVLVGSDRTTARGDVCNKIGTYLKALAARDCGVPFYVAVPSSSIDFAVHDGLTEIPIEERDAEEVTGIVGQAPDGSEVRVRLVPEGTAAANFAFDVTPAALVTALITERGVCPASADGLRALYPERA